MPPSGEAQGLRLAELIAALSLASDLGLGQPMEHVVRSTLIATRLGERMGLDDQERAGVYYVSLLAWVGCMADAYEVAQWFGDDIAFKAATYDVDLAGLPMLGFMLRRAGTGSPALHRARLAAALLVTGGKQVEGAMRAACQATTILAQRLCLGDDVARPLSQTFTRWDGKGMPSGVGGDEVALSMRLVHLAEMVEVPHRVHGVEAAVELAQDRSGKQFDPALVREFCEVAPELLGTLRDDTNWDSLIEEEPALRPRLTDTEIDRDLEAIADFSDLKSPWFSSHSRGVADLAAAAAERAGLAADGVVVVRRAGLLHDLGRVGVPNTIWDKPGPLTRGEWEKVRLHGYYTERMLARPPALARIGAIAAFDHERMDGSGYHRAVPGASVVPAGRVLAAADAYHAMTEARPYRGPKSPEEAAEELRGEVKGGHLDGDAVDAVLGAAGHGARRRRSGPGGLTAREIEVLVAVARGLSNKDIAHLLHISQKTVGNHVEHVYTKLGVSSRTSAALFAMQHGLLEPLSEPTPGK